jgi:hypothetical protein
VVAPPTNPLKPFLLPSPKAPLFSSVSGHLVVKVPSLPKSQHSSPPFLNTVMTSPSWLLVSRSEVRIYTVARQLDRLPTLVLEPMPLQLPHTLASFVTLSRVRVWPTSRSATSIPGLPGMFIPSSLSALHHSTDSASAGPKVASTLSLTPATSSEWMHTHISRTQWPTASTMVRACSMLRWLQPKLQLEASPFGSPKLDGQ